MTDAEATIWGIHAGKTGDADSLFLLKNVIALGWGEMGDLRRLGGTREAFKDAVGAAYPHKKPGAIPNNAGQLYRFVHEVTLGDLVAYPSKRDRHIHIGRVSSDYKYQSSGGGYPHQRVVQWFKAVPRTVFSQGALYEIGSAMSFFQIRNYGEEYRSALEGRVAPVVAKEDDTVSIVAGETEDSARDYVLKRLAQDLKGHPFAEFIAHLLNTMGYRTRVSPEGPDGGIDIIAHKDELGFEPPIIKVQVKSGEGSVGDPVVSALYGKIEQGEYGLFVTLGTFTAPARSFGRSKSNLRLLDGDELVGLIFQHYEQFDSKYKGMLPLRRVYIPEVVDDAENE
jgi:restriction system protein